MVDQSAASHVHIDAAVDQTHRHENKAKPGQINHAAHGSVTHLLGSKIMVQGVKATQVSIMIQSSDQTLCASIAAPPTKTFEIEAVDLCYKPPQPLARQMWLPGWKKMKQETSRSTGDVVQDIDNKESTNSREEGGAFILKNVNCKAKAGEVLAIAGPSGAGKSTLLEVLAGNIRPSSPSSSLLINKQPMDVSSFRRISGFVPQHDALFPLLTVKETLMYSARLRLPSSVCREEKEKRVWSLMQELGLLHVADTRVGDNDQIRGISGGERRRVSIGMDVIHDPSVLLLDEPTSGLDSAAALNVVEMLHCMAKTRFRTIILSIHQPGYRIMQHITSFLLLAKGRVVHLGSLKLLERQLVEAGHKIPSQVNVLEYAIEEMSLTGADQLSGLQYKNGSSVRDHFAEKNGQTLMLKMDDEGRGLGSLKGNLAGSGAGGGGGGGAGGEVIGVMVGPEDVAGEEKPGYANGGLTEVVILSQRFGKNIFRTYDLFVVRTLQAVVAGFALGSIYARVGEDPRGAAERLGFFAFTLTFLLSSTVEALPVFIKERQVLERETSRGAYRVASYVVANAAVFAPFLLLVAALYAVPVYYLMGLSGSASAFGFFVLVTWLVLLEANAFVAFFGALAPDFIVGNSLISASMGAFFLFSGYFISKQDMPPYWRFMHYVSLFKYPLDALLTNEYASLPPSACFDGLPRHHGDQQQDPCLVTPDLILQQLGLLHNSKWLDLAVMLTFIVAYRFLAYAVLAVKVAKRRN